MTFCDTTAGIRARNTSGQRSTAAVVERYTDMEVKMVIQIMYEYQNVNIKGAFLNQLVKDLGFLDTSP